MSWRFWEPRQTAAGVAGRLAGGLRDGSVVLGEPFAGDPDDGLVVHLDVPAGCSDGEVLDTVKALAVAADERHRDGGGHGLALGEVEVVPDGSVGRAVRVSLRPRVDADRPELLGDVPAIPRQRADLPLVRDTGA